MCFKFATVVFLLAMASSGNARPRDPDPLDSSSSQEVATETLDAVNRSGTLDSRQEQIRELKDIQSMDQSLRTVATQLLNVTTKREDLVRIPEEKIVTIETPMQVVHISTRVEDVVSDNSNNKEDESSKLKFGIPMNSKFGHFEMSNPGHAMAMTEEEIEREMASAITTQKHRPTTTSMLSTWIQLYPPSTTTEGKNISDIKIYTQNNLMHPTTSTTLPPTVYKPNTEYTKPIRNTEIKQTIIPYTEIPVLTTKLRNSSISDGSDYVKLTTTTSTTFIENNINETDSTEKKSQNKQNQRPNFSSVRPTTKSTLSTKKISSKNSTTIKPKVTTIKNSVTKLIKGNSTINRLKPFSTRRPIKNDTVTSVSKIEKVTLKPATFITPNYTTNANKSVFVTKIKASVLTDSQKPTTIITTMNPLFNIISKSNFSSMGSGHTKVPNPTQVNNILKVHLKKPVDDSTKIEIEPIRVNPPVLTIEKIEDTNANQKVSNEDQDILENSKIDVKFEFNPEYADVKLQTSSNESSSSVRSPTTTKRPRLSHKRKKNKNRRRKPASTTISAMPTPSSSSFDINDLQSLDLGNNGNNVNNDKLQLTEIQESKIEPESKAPPSKKKKPTQTQVQKPIGTQIYNFLSREVMPSVGVMSLVGLGLGLASYFLYPFGGVIARRNYDVEPNYKYNLDEYGGNYGLSEEEVLSKVYSGMTGGQHHETKYNSIATSEKNPTFYRYTGAEQMQQQPSRYPTHVKNTGNRVIYRPVETTSYDVNYRNTEFKYPDVSTTPNYYERQRQQHLSTDFVSNVAKVGIAKNRQFVVGNIPKEYSSREELDVVKLQDKTNHNLQISENEKHTEDNSSALPLTVEALKPLENPMAYVSNINKEHPTEIYEEVEITPAAVAVEHGPRYLKLFNDVPKVELMDSKSIRKKRSSVIQMIPTKSEIEKENKMQEEDLNNEILNIIDDVLPEKSDHQNKMYNGKNNYTNDAATKKQHTKVFDNLSNIMNKVTTKNNNTAVVTNSGKPSTIVDKTMATSVQKIVNQAPSTSTVPTTIIATSSPQELTEPNLVHQNVTMDLQNNITTTEKPKPSQTNGIDIIGIAKRIAEIKLRLGLTILKHASEGLARYIGHIQKRFNGEE